MFPFPSHCSRCQGFEAFMALKHHPVWGKDNQMTCVWRRHCLVDKVMRASVQNREPEVPDRDSGGEVNVTQALLRVVFIYF